jgi:hypothetical protein
VTDKPFDDFADSGIDRAQLRHAGPRRDRAQDTP